MTAKTVCDFLHCEAEDTLIVTTSHAGHEWGLCPFHSQLVERNGVSIEHEGGRDYLFTPVMIRGKAE